jgi:hypothetical protein
VTSDPFKVKVVARITCTSVMHAENLVLRIDRSPRANEDPSLETSVHGRYVTLWCDDGERLASLIYHYAANLLERGFVKKITMTAEDR